MNSGDKTADMYHHAARPPEYQAGGDSKRESLCQQDSQRVTRKTTGASNIGRPVATEDSSSEKKVNPNNDGKSASGRLAILQIISSRRARRFTNVKIKCRTGYVQDLVKILSILQIARSTLRCGANLLATAYGLPLGRRLQMDGNG